ncbi:MAG: glycosyltransferase family 39 protein [Bacteroidota bacterium]|nr:glycosyltransferase family 39 protein [Bacteroidota bacterium]
MEKTYSNNPGNRFLFPFFGRLSPRMFFLLVFAFQVMLIFQGFDLSDEGFLSIFYRRIFSDPVSVSYNFMFWLTGIIGGLWVKLVSPLGLWGIRLGGAIVNTITVAITYNLLRKYLNPEYLKLGLLLVVLSLNNDIKVLNYNTLSSLFYVIAIYFLHSGLKKAHWGKIFLGGFFVGLNVFIRTPNILELGLVLGIIYYCHLTHQRIGKTVWQITGFIAGFLAGAGCVLFAMYLTGHLDIFLDSLKLLFSMGKVKTGNPAAQNGYGLSRLLYLFWANNIQSIKYAGIFSAGTLGTAFLMSRFENQSKLIKHIAGTAFYGIVALILLLIIIHRIDHFTILFFITGVVLITAVFLVSAPIDLELKILFFFGCFFLLSFPLGSSDGLYTAGRYCLWIALPVAIDYLLHLHALQNTLVINRNKREYSRKVWISEKQLTITKRTLLYLVIFGGFYHAYYYPFFDRRNRTEMHYALHSDHLKGIYTTRGRADAFNELLQASAKYIRPNDHVMAYDRIAMYYYASNTIPFLGNSLPSVYNADLFRSDLHRSIERNPVLPVVIRQKIATTGTASKWPEEILPGDYSRDELSVDRNNILDSFLVQYGYREVWENVAFKILIPDKSKTSSE